MPCSPNAYAKHPTHRHLPRRHRDLAAPRNHRRRRLRRGPRLHCHRHRYRLRALARSPPRAPRLPPRGYRPAPEAQSATSAMALVRSLSRSTQEFGSLLRPKKASSTLGFPPGPSIQKSRSLRSLQVPPSIQGREGPPSGRVGTARRTPATLAWRAGARLAGRCRGR